MTGMNECEGIAILHNLNILSDIRVSTLGNSGHVTNLREVLLFLLSLPFSVFLYLNFLQSPVSSASSSLILSHQSSRMLFHFLFFFHFSIMDLNSPLRLFADGPLKSCQQAFTLSLCLPAPSPIWPMRLLARQEIAFLAHAAHEKARRQRWCKGWERTP